MSEHDDRPDADEGEPSFIDFVRAITTSAMLNEAMETALSEFVEIRWPHLEQHDAVTEEDASNPFTGGTVAMFLALVELKALDRLFLEMRRQETLPAHLCPFATTVHNIVARTGEAEQAHAVHEAALNSRPEDPRLN